MTTNDESDLACGSRPRAITNPESSVARDALARCIAARLGRCSYDELRVLDVLMERLELGRDRYGHLDLARARDWDRELSEELFDVAVYRAILDVRRQDVDRAELRRASAIELGLYELRDVTPITEPRPRIEFEMPDLGGEGG